jgi:hypothetical protein
MSTERTRDHHPTCRCGKAWEESGAKAAVGNTLTIATEPESSPSGDAGGRQVTP